MLLLLQVGVHVHDVDVDAVDALARAKTLDVHAAAVHVCAFQWRSTILGRRQRHRIIGRSASGGLGVLEGMARSVANQTYQFTLQRILCSQKKAF